MSKVVLAGGPCGGKSTTHDAVKREFPGRVMVFPEIATALLDEGYPQPGKDVEWSLEWQIGFQGAILPRQREEEEICEAKAKQKGIDLLVCDRGELCGAAYLPGGREQFAQHFGIDVESAMSKYAAVIHLESTATGDPAFYGSANNKHRFESLDRARMLEMGSREAWRGHPDWHFLSCRYGIEGKIQRVCELIRSMLES